MAQSVNVPGVGTLNFPDDMSQADMAAAIQRNFPQIHTNPTDGNSFLGNVTAGIGKGMTDLALGAKQRLDDAATYLENKFGGQSINSALGLQNAADIQKQTQAEVDEKRRLDVPLMQTTGGKVGNIVGQTAMALPLSLIPGSQSLIGSVATGAALGTAMPTAADESVLKNAALGGIGGAAGYGLAKGIGAMAGKAAPAETSAGQAVNDIASTARDAGYTLPPSQTNNSLLNNILEGLSGKLQMRQQAAVKNQGVTNSLAAKALGLPEDTPITVDSLNGIRNAAGNAYKEVKQVGTFGLDNQYEDALSAIASKYTNAAKDFPNLAKDDIPAIINSFKPTGTTFDSGSAIDAIGVAREMADNAYAAGNKGLGGVYKSSAKALEDLVDRNLQTYESAFPGNGFGELLDGFRAARQLIAKTYSVQKGLNVATGDVNAAALGSQLQKGVPLTDELLTIANTNKAFPFATKAISNTSHPGVSPLDLIAGTTGSVASGSVLPMLLGPGRMAVRNMMLSSPYQAMFGSANSGVSGAINSTIQPIGNAASNLAPVIGNIGASLSLQERQAQNITKLRAYEDKMRAQKIANIGNAKTVDEAIDAFKDSTQ